MKNLIENTILIISVVTILAAAWGGIVYYKKTHSPAQIEQVIKETVEIEEAAELGVEVLGGV